MIDNPKYKLYFTKNVYKIELSVLVLIAILKV